MKVSELIKHLQEIEELRGDLTVTIVDSESGYATPVQAISLPSHLVRVKTEDLNPKQEKRSFRLEEYVLLS